MKKRFWDIRVNNLDEIWQNAKDLKGEIEREPMLNPNSKKKEFSLRDLDGYYLTIIE